MLTVPGAPELSLVSTTADTVTVSWRVPEGTVVKNYEIQWRVREGESLSMTTAHTDESLSSFTDQYTISGLQQIANGIIEILVTAVNKAGSNTSAPFILHTNTLRNSPTTEESSSSNNINIGIIIGGAVGISLISFVFGIAILCVCALLMLRRNKQNKTR